MIFGNIFNKTIIPENDFTYYEKAQSNLEASEMVKKHNFSNMSIFIKGSRKLELEKLIDYL